MHHRSSMLLCNRMLTIPEQWKSKRQRIVEAFCRTGSVPDAAEEVYGKRNVSYVRYVIITWKKISRKEEIVQHSGQSLVK